VGNRVAQVCTREQDGARHMVVVRIPVAVAVEAVAAMVVVGMELLRSSDLVLGVDRMGCGSVSFLGMTGVERNRWPQQPRA
jgi:hypothetical protein